MKFAKSRVQWFMLLEHMNPSERSVILIVSKRIQNVLMNQAIERVRYMPK